ncbi:neurabin-1-like isoform X2 [Notamacropus eugenii]|uniref:neurabin-1-like isoform X2 n=1 Tax=Notamacropus eugenii TaxID=9315 RepID=UPI003B67322A
MYSLLCSGEDEKGLGILIRLFYDLADKDEKQPFVIILEIVEGGAAHKSGKFQVFDQILNVDGTNLVGLSREQIDSAFKKMGPSVWIQIGRETPENMKHLLKHLMKEEERKRCLLNSTKNQVLNEIPTKDIKAQFVSLFHIIKNDFCLKNKSLLLGSTV